MTNKVLPDVATEQVKDLVSQISLPLIADVIEALQGYDMSMSRFAVLCLLNDNEGITITAVAISLRLSVGSASQLIDRLEADRLLLRLDDENDRRIRRIYLTDQGTLLIAQMKKIRFTRITTLLNNMSPQIFAQVCTIMQVMSLSSSKDSCATLVK